MKHGEREVVEPVDAVDPGDAEEPQASPAPYAQGRVRRPWLWGGGAAVAVAAALGIGWAVWPDAPAVAPETVTVLGVDYRTNVPVDDVNGYVYVHLPVNAQASDIVFEVGDAADDSEIRAFLDELDTLVPGEHVITLSQTNLHVIIDGINE